MIGDLVGITPLLLALLKVQKQQAKLFLTVKRETVCDGVGGKMDWNKNVKQG